MTGLFLITALWLACHAPGVYQRSPQCSVRMHAVADTYENAGDVRVTFEPASLSEIAILLPWDANFVAVDLAKEPQWATSGVLDPKRSRAAARKYPIAWGIPSSAWYANRKPIGKGRYELPPGRYQIIAKYQKGDSDRCYAATQPFVIQQSTFWVSTEE